MVFSIILCTTLLTTALSFLVDKTFVSNIYGSIFKVLGLGKTKPIEPSEEALREDPAEASTIDVPDRSLEAAEEEHTLLEEKSDPPKTP